MEILKVEGLTKVYNENNVKLTALNNVSFKVEKGEFVAIIGASGSGKSTLIHLLGGVDNPTSGKVIVDGIDVYSLKEEKLAEFRRQKVGLVYQFYNLIPVLNVEENISLPISLDGKKTDKKHLDDLIETLGLSDRRKHLPNQLSGGEQQRVAIGRALIYKPSLLLADEPTGNLDSKGSENIIELLKASNEKYGQTIIMITHDLNIAKYAKRIITIKDGSIIKDELVNGYESSL